MSSYKTELTIQHQYLKSRDMVQYLQRCWSKIPPPLIVHAITPIKRGSLFPVLWHYNLLWPIKCSRNGTWVLEPRPWEALLSWISELCVKKSDKSAGETTQKDKVPVSPHAVPAVPPEVLAMEVTLTWIIQPDQSSRCCYLWTTLSETNKSTVQLSQDHISELQVNK